MPEAQDRHWWAEALGNAAYGRPDERLILLGAGASAEAGLPLGNELARALLETEELRVFEHVWRSLDGHEIRDVERAIAVLEGLASLQDSSAVLSDLARLAVVVPHEDLEAHVAAHDLRRIRQSLRRLLWLPDGLGVGVVDRILGRSYEAPDRVAYLSKIVHASRGSTIATLNYDNVIELAGGPAVVTTRPESKRVLVPDERFDQVRLLKLHGSLEWVQIGDDVIGGGKPLEKVAYEPAIIFGAGNKLRHFGPFLELLRAFTTKLQASRVVITIGYGFRDAHVNDALRIWAATPGASMKKIIICLGSGGQSLPPVAVPWQLHEHLDVQLAAMSASELASALPG